LPLGKFETMTALGWNRPLDAITTNGGYAQLVTFAK